MSNFSEALNLLREAGAKAATPIKVDNASSGRSWIVYVNGINAYIQNEKLVVIKFANGDGFKPSREISTKKYAEVLTAAGFTCEVKKNRLFVTAKESGK